MNTVERLQDWWRESEERTRRRAGIVVIMVLAAAVLLSLTNSQIDRLGKRRASRERDLTEMMSLRQRLLVSRAGAQGFANRLAATKPDDTPAKIIEEIGIRGKGIRISPLKSETQGAFIVELAEVRIDGLSINEAVNLLFRLEKGNRSMVIRKALLKVRFDDPAKLDLAFTLGLLKGAVAQ